MQSTTRTNKSCLPAFSRHTCFLPSRDLVSSASFLLNTRYYLLDFSPRLLWTDPAFHDSINSCFKLLCRAFSKSPRFFRQVEET
ncbi:hypothetical protein VTL71DRAFT_8576 [Oculimacula yallundae]|uniref:Uncharacterized protein n=1 Tax=Oculimacula yallundae TaxID=86028 RepID=A0ABR4CY53_9HELO